MLHLRSVRRPVLSILVFLVGCSSADQPHAIFALPRDGADHAFFDLPWPSDLRRTDSGTIDVTAWPNPLGQSLHTLYTQAISETVGGYATSGSAYVRFSHSIDPSTLPTSEADSLQDTASVFIVDVDPDSSTRGMRHPAVIAYRDEATTYWPARTLAVRPVLGIPLAPNRTYAVVVTDAVRQSNGDRLERDRDFAHLLEDTGDTTVAAARSVYQPALDTLVDMGVETEEILSLAVFTTQDPTAELIAARDWMVENYAMPQAVNSEWRWVEQDDRLIHVKGAFHPAPMFMQGAVPFVVDGSTTLTAENAGGIRFEGETPVVSSEFTMRFTLTVPRTPMPDDGYPIVIYAHGTGGDWEDVLSDAANDLADFGFAALGFNQIHHGDRNPTETDPAYLVFNAFNPWAFRENARQSALDVVQIARFVRSVEVATSVVAAQDGEPVHFDPEEVYYFGHSQGGLNGPLFLAIDDQTKGGILSGAGAGFLPALVDKTEPINIPQLVMLGLGLPGVPPEDEHLTYEHPIATLLQTWLEVADNANYVHMMFDQPRAGFAPKVIFQTEGTTDPYTPPASIEALSTAARIPQVEPMVRAIEAHATIGLAPIVAPTSNNVADGNSTAGIMQWTGGHFVAFEDSQGRPFVRGFWNSVANGAPQVGASVSLPADE